MMDEMPIEEGEFVLEVLSLYRAIEGFKSNHAAKAIRGHAFGCFRGFDGNGNGEGSYYMLARFILDKQRGFSEQAQYRDKTDDFNSHWPLQNAYRVMLDRWERLGRKFDLTEEEILGIISV